MPALCLTSALAASLQLLQWEMLWEENEEVSEAPGLPFTLRYPTRVLPCASQVPVAVSQSMKADVLENAYHVNGSHFPDHR